MKNKKTYERICAVARVGTSLLGNKLGVKGYNSVAPYLNNGFERGLMNAIISAPSTVVGSGLNKAITGRR